MLGLSRPSHGARVIAKLLMPWLFVSRKLGWTPFAKVRREGYILRARRKIRRVVVLPS
jgi:hypothetical protein